VNHFGFLSFWLSPLNCPGFIEIGEMACATPAWCSQGRFLNTFFSKFPAKRKKEII